MLELELCSEKVSGERDALREGLHALETSRKELADEYIILKSNYLALGKELDQEVRHCSLWCPPVHTIYTQLGFGLCITAWVQHGLPAVSQQSLGMGSFSGSWKVIIFS